MRGNVLRAANDFRNDMKTVCYKLCYARTAAMTTRLHAKQTDPSRANVRDACNIAEVGMLNERIR